MRCRAATFNLPPLLWYHDLFVLSGAILGVQRLPAFAGISHSFNVPAQPIAAPRVSALLQKKCPHHWNYDVFAPACHAALVESAVRHASALRERAVRIPADG